MSEMTVTYHGKCLICGRNFTVTIPLDKPLQCPYCPEPKIYYDTLHFQSSEKEKQK